MAPAWSLAVMLTVSAAYTFCSAQEIPSTEQSRHSHWIGVYPELAGNGALMSANLEYMYTFRRNTLGTYLRGGKGVLLLGGSSSVVESGFLIGKKSNYFDVGIGYTLYDVHEAHSGRQYFYALRLGYRYQGPKGLLLRIAPLFGEVHKTDQHTEFLWFGLGIGYSFRVNRKG